MPGLTAPQQGRGVRDEVPEDLIPLFHRLARLRVMTSAQAHYLVEPLARHTKRNAHERLRLLVRDKFLRADLVEPPSGARSAHFFGLTSKSLRFLQRTDKRYLLARPQQHILEYLLFRNEIYAAARAAGWYIASPVFTPAADQVRYLRLYAQWVQREKELELARAAPGGAEFLRLQLEFERLPLFAPKTLTFEFAVRVDIERCPIDLLLLVIDDPRRSIEKQVAELPSSLPPATRLLVRDTQSRYDQARSAILPSPRLRRWRRALARRFGDELLARDALFSDLWARRIRPRRGPGTEPR